MLLLFLVLACIAGASLADRSTRFTQCEPRTSPVRIFREKDACPRPIGLEPDPDYKPWTHKPRCRTGKDPANGKKSRYCLYTKSNLDTELGFSIITTPGIANFLAKHLHFDVYDKMVNAPASQSYTSRDIVGRGIGLYANTEVKAGEVVMNDFVTFVLNRDAINFLRDEDRHWLQWRGLMQLPEARQKSLLGLAQNLGGDAIDDVFNTNGIGLKYQKDDEHGAILSEVSRMNHACRPNVLYRSNEEQSFVQVLALRDIKVGEELTITYSEPDLNSTERKSFLHTNWGFNCTCSLCNAPAKELASSDQRLASIARLGKEAREPDQSPREVYRIANEILELYDEEQLVTPKPAVHEMAAKAAYELGNYKAALRHGKDAVELYRLIEGPTMPEYKRAVELVRKIKRTA